MNNDFSALVKAAKKGDRHSFALLYSNIYKELYRYALFTLRSQQDAEDCVSEAVIDAYRTIGNLKNEESFKAWFFKILSAKRSVRYAVSAEVCRYLAGMEIPPTAAPAPVV